MSVMVLQETIPEPGCEPIPDEHPQGMHSMTKGSDGCWHCPCGEVRDRFGHPMPASPRLASPSVAKPCHAIPGRDEEEATRHG